MFNLKDKYVSVHFYNERLSFPVMLLAKDKQESDFILNYLTKERTTDFTVIDFINWSDAHGIDFQVLFPDYKNLLKISLHDPVRFGCFVKIQNRIKQSTNNVTIL